MKSTPLFYLPHIPGGRIEISAPVRTGVCYSPGHIWYLRAEVIARFSCSDDGWRLEEQPHDPHR